MGDIGFGRLRRLRWLRTGNAESYSQPSGYILATVAIYLDFLNIFLYLLSALNGGNKNN